MRNRGRKTKGDVKKRRHDLIESILRAQYVNTQGELVDIVRGMGYQVSQTTINRDIIEMRLHKVRGPSGRSHYVMPREDERNPEEGFAGALHDFCTHIDTAGTNVAIGCRAGAAGTLASAVDILQLPDVVGSLAGYDVCVLFLKTADKAEAARYYINELWRGQSLRGASGRSAPS